MADWLNKLQDNFNNKIITDKKFSDLTTLKIGGPIKAFIEVKNQNELMEVLRFVNQNSIPFLVIGHGSNLLVSDNGLDKLVIKNSIEGIEKNGDILTVKAGTILQDLVNFTIQNGLEGFSNMTGIPGTVGGAVYGDAGAYGNSIRDYIKEVRAFDGQKIICFSKKNCQFGYRDSVFKSNKFTILEVDFEGMKPQPPETLRGQSEEIRLKREIKYPPGIQCPGSFFKNVITPNLPSPVLEKVKHLNTRFNKIPAGILIQEVGGKGDRLNQIKIADNHGNTFINLGGGNAKDFYNLASKYFKKVKEKFGIELEPEVQLINLPQLKD